MIGIVTRILVLFIVVPGISLSAQITVSIPIDEDAQVYYKEGSSAMESNFGSHANLSVLTGTAGPPTIWRSFVRIDLASIPASAVITEAVLKLRVISVNQISGSNEVVLHSTGDSWNESTITWNNQPAYAVDVSDPTVPAGGTGIREVDITEWVKSAVASEDFEFSFMMKQITEVAGQYRKMTFASSDHSTPEYHPVLELTYFPNNIYIDATIDEDNNIHQMPWEGIQIKVDRHFLASSSELIYQILDADNEVQIPATSDYIMSEGSYIEIDDSTLNLASGETYCLVLINSRNEKRFLKFIK